MNGAPRKPVIGITSYVEDAAWSVWDQPAVIVPLSYADAVEEAGGRPLIVPPSDDAVGETLDALDGIVFCGGSDVDPLIYGADPHPKTTGVQPDRDNSEIELLEAAMARGMPVLAICRGMQLLNVVRGGDLMQHLPDVVGEGGHKEGPGVFAEHEVDIDPDSRLGAILGERATVASHHHQAPGRIGDGLRKVAWAPDKTTEGIEDPAARMVVGVLWHPEKAEDRALFRALVNEAGDYRRERR